MVPKLEGKVGIITGAGHGMGAAHAVALAREGASVALVDICRDQASVPVPGATDSALAKSAQSGISRPRSSSITSTRQLPS
jgi:NAD(P)-dependent dehydrogenase (short-subunit alcohol dehydrogenase family)